MRSYSLTFSHSAVCVCATTRVHNRNLRFEGNAPPYMAAERRVHPYTPTSARKLAAGRRKLQESAEAVAMAAAGPNAAGNAAGKDEMRRALEAARESVRERVDSAASLHVRMAAAANQEVLTREEWDKLAADCGGVSNLLSAFEDVLGECIERAGLRGVAQGEAAANQGKGTRAGS
jgi:hypothetical protein